MKVRQIVASSLPEIPEFLRENYETLLNDLSYKTKETAFVNLISNFPNRKIEYLNRTKNISSFNDKSFEMLWMVYAHSIPNYIENPQELLSILSNYTSNNFEFSIRQNALEYIKKIDNLSIQNLEDLLDCCLLPNWRNAKWSKEFLKEILKDTKIKSEYLKILPNLSSEKQILLNRFLKEV